MIAIAPKCKKLLSYDDAILYCQFLNYNGYTDWRLPTFAECKEYSLGYDHWWQVDMKFRPGLLAPVNPVRDI